MLLVYHPQHVVPIGEVASLRLLDVQSSCLHAKQQEIETAKVLTLTSH